MTCKLVRYPAVTPNHAGGTDFSAELPLPDGVIKKLIIDLRGTTVGTAAIAHDAPARLVQRLRIEFPRVGAKSYVIDAPLRDIARLADILNGRTGLKDQPTSATTFSLEIELPLYVPNMPAGHEWGIDTRELAGSVLVSGTWAAAAEYGTTTSAITAGELRVHLCVVDEDEEPRFALLPIGTRITVDSATHFERLLSKGELDGAFGVMLRSFDASGAALADRADGLYTIAKLKHSAEGEIIDATEGNLREAMASYFRMSNDELAAAAPNGFLGLVFAVLNPELYPGSYPDLVGADLTLHIDAETGQPTSHAALVPAAGDAVFATLVGVQANDLLLELIDGEE